MLTLTQINIFPVKSLDGFSPASAIVEKEGLQHDRRWLITDTEGVFMTQRTNAKMALLRAIIEDNALIIKEKQNESHFIKIPITRQEQDFHTVEIWDDTVKAVSVSEEANAWLSDFIGKKCRLVTMPSGAHRRVDEKYNLGDDIVSFADGYPFLIIGEASMQDLNERISLNSKFQISTSETQNSKLETFTPLSVRRFRPNFIFNGGEPFEEDTFKNFKIGEVDFIGVKPCARCVLTTRDPDTGIKGREPLETLSTYRQQGTKILFGQNLVWNRAKWDCAWQPEVKVGDIIAF